MITYKHAYRSILSLLLASSILITPASMVAQPDQQNSIKKTICAYWREWYNFRHQYVYPANDLISCLSLFTNVETNPLNDLRRKAGYDKVPDYCNTGYPLLTAQFGVGIVDALMAEKLIENIAKDDIVHFISFYGCLVALDKACPHMLPSLNNHLSPEITQSCFFRIATSYLKLKVARICAHCIGRPVGHIVCQAIKACKKMTSQKEPKQFLFPVPQHTDA